MKIIMFCLAILVLMGLLVQSGWASEVYPISPTMLEEVKKSIDDPRPYLKDTNYLKKWIPKSVWDKVTYDIEDMKKVWAEVVGFRAPDVVGKKANEIKPGKYTYKDKEKYPFKELMPPTFYNKFNPGGANGVNIAGNFTEIEVIPTRQYYWALPIAQNTQKNMGIVKMDNQGYIDKETYKGGYPFPRPSGPNRAIQYVYNHLYNYIQGEDYMNVENNTGVNKNFKIDRRGLATYMNKRVGGRSWMPPYGFLDKRAEKNSEYREFIGIMQAPREIFGNVYKVTRYIDPKKSNLILAYVNTLRRVRKISGTDTQDQVIGIEACYDDDGLLIQGLSPDFYPYEYRVLDEGEYLIPYSIDGDEYADSKNNFIYRNLKFERRPMVIIEMKQKDPNYVYSKRILYIDKETLCAVFEEMYDQKGRHYRSSWYVYSFYQNMGILSMNLWQTADHIDFHSTLGFAPSIPALWLQRNDVSIESMLKAK